MSEVAVDAEVLSGQLLDDLVLTLDVEQQGFVLLLYGLFLLKELGKTILDFLLLLLHLCVGLSDSCSHLSVMTLAEGELFLEFDQVARACLDASNVLLLGLELDLQTLHLIVVAFNLRLEDLLLVLVLGKLLFQLKVLGDKQFFLTSYLFD